MSEEKRNHPRLKVRVPVELRQETTETPIRGETADLSLGGFYIEMMFTLEIGTVLDITLQVDDSTLLAAGEVVTCDRTVGNGIRFTSMLPEDREDLERFLQAVEAKQQGTCRPRTRVSGPSCFDDHSCSSYSSVCSGNSTPQSHFSGSTHSAPICFSEEPSRAMTQTTRN
jgi:hypothetical protein